MTSLNDPQRVAIAIIQRRGALGLTQDEARREAAVGLDTWGRVERGQDSKYRATVLAAIERALGWSSGTIENIDQGGDPPSTINPEIEERFLRLEERLEEISRLVEKPLGQ